MSSNTLDIHEVLTYLPHRYPFLLIDRVLDYTPGESLVAMPSMYSEASPAVRSTTSAT